MDTTSQVTKYLNSNIYSNKDISPEEKAYWIGLIEDTQEAIQQLRVGKIYSMQEMVPEMYLDYMGGDHLKRLEAHIYLLMVLDVFPIKPVGKNSANLHLYMIEHQYQFNNTYQENQQ